MDRMSYNCNDNIIQNLIPTMLDHQKTVLKEICNDKERFITELKKTLVWISQQEQTQFKHWVFQHFYLKYSEIIIHIFKQDQPPYNIKSCWRATLF